MKPSLLSNADVIAGRASAGHRKMPYAALLAAGLFAAACSPAAAADSPVEKSVSAVTSAAVTATPTINFASGFTATNLKLNGNAVLSGTKLRLTDGGQVEASSAYYATPVNVQSFTSDFTFQLTAANGDGFTFVVQGVGPTALGASGNGLGYQNILKSVAIKFDLYDNAGEGVNSTGLYTNGAQPTMPAVTLVGSGIDLHSGHTLSAHLVYSGTTLSMTLTDPTTAATVTKSFTIDIPGTVGAATAYVGFTGGDFGATAIQDITTWTLSSSTAVAPPPVAPAPVAVAVSPASASVATSASQTFTCSVTGSTNTACNWAVSEGAAGGSISAAGVYTAPAAAGASHVVATSQADTTKTATAVVTVTAPAAGAPPPANANTWVNVTPANASLDFNFGVGSNYGAQTIMADPHLPSNVYAHFDNQGIWKSTNYGQSWTGPINTGTNGATIAGAGGMNIPKAGPSNPPRIYLANIRDPGTGFWRSNDGGVNWTKYNVAPGGARQDFYPPTSDPYDADHLLMPAHEQNLLVQSIDGGQTWTQINMVAGMNQSGGTAFLFFIDTGVPSTTRKTWLYLAQGTGGSIGTWRTTDGGTTWTKVDSNEHPHGNSQIYQPDTSGVVFMSGVYSALGWGVLKSTDYGAHWIHVGITGQEGGGLIGTANHLYSEWAWSLGQGTVNPDFEVSPSTAGTGTWAQPSSAGISQGAAQFVTVNDGSHNIILSANCLAGLWRYVESETSTTTNPPPVVAVPTISSFTASPASVSSGASSTLAWSTANATSLSINGAAVTGTSKVVTPTATTAYTLTATNSGGSTTATATVTVTVAPVVAVTISPATASVVASKTQGFSCAITNSTDTACTWTVREGATGGSVTAAGVYAAPSAAGTYHVVATSHADATKSATATITVTAAPVVAVTISPATASVVASKTQGFSCAITNSTDTACTWTVQEAATGGSVTAAGLYTASSAAGTYHVVATSHADATKSATAIITVTAAPVIAVAVSPTAASVATGATTAFACTVTNSTDTACTWVVQEGTTGGSISTTGAYTAPAAAGTFHVVAASHADATKTAVATVTVTASTTAPGARPALTINGSSLLDPHGNKVILRGVNSQGMAQVYGDKANPGTYVPMTPAQYVNRALQTDATGIKWSPTVIRLNFERFPSTDPARLYTTENQPYAMPDTVTFSPWAASTSYTDGTVATFGGTRYRAAKRTWRADRGAAWNPGAYVVGDVLSGFGNGNDNHLYRAVAASGAGPSANWAGGPSGVSTTTPVTDAMGNQWIYVGEFGQSGGSEPFGGATMTDYGVGTVFPDHFVWWQNMSPDYTAAQALANFTDWKTKVMDPAIQTAVSAGLYVIVTDFDFGPAEHPLRHARMLDFWTRMAKSQWANNPQVIFELWNESEDIGSYAGGAGSWAVQKPVIQETINAVRAAGANNIIVVPTPFFSAWIGEATASPLTGTNIAYALHAYRSQWEAFSSNRDQVNQGLASGQAIFMTEWGDDTNPASATSTWATTSTISPALRGMIEPSEGALHPVIGWVAWALTNSWTPDLFSDAALTQPTPFGQATAQWMNDKKADSQPVP
jgi:hypothetical protein